MTPIRLVILCFLVMIFPFAISIVITLTTSGEEEYEHAMSGKDRLSSPGCVSCHGLMVEIDMQLKKSPLPPKPTTNDEGGNSGGGGGGPDEIESLTMVSAARMERANEILHSVCRLNNVNQRALCQRNLRRQRKEILTYIFNISLGPKEIAQIAVPQGDDENRKKSGGSSFSFASDENGEVWPTAEWVCIPMCVGTSFDVLGDFALRQLGHPLLRRLGRTLSELWGPVLILTVTGSLLGMTLHVRVAASKLLLVSESLPPGSVAGGGGGNADFDGYDNINSSSSHHHQHHVSGTGKGKPSTPSSQHPPSNKGGGGKRR